MSRSQKSTLASLAAFVALNPSADGALVTGTWVKASGATGVALTNPTTASPTWGDGTTDNADASSIYSPTPTITLANPGDKVALTSAVYNFSFTLERNALNGLIITTSLVRTSDSLQFAGASFTDTTVNAGAFTFDRVGFQGTTDLNADQIQLNNVDVTFTAVPEPSATLLGGLGVLALLRRRRWAPPVLTRSNHPIP